MSSGKGSSGARETGTGSSKCLKGPWLALDASCASSAVLECSRGAVHARRFTGHGSKRTDVASGAGKFRGPARFCMGLAGIACKTTRGSLRRLIGPMSTSKAGQAFLARLVLACSTRLARGCPRTCLHKAGIARKANGCTRQWLKKSRVAHVAYHRCRCHGKHSDPACITARFSFHALRESGRAVQTRCLPFVGLH